MTNLHAYGFLLLGGLCHLLPRVAPAHFPPNSLDGANTSALWLQVMGVVQGAIGVFYILRLDVLPFIAQVMAWRPAPLPELLPENVFRPAALEVPDSRMRARDNRRLAA